MFPGGGHLGYRVELSDIIFEGGVKVKAWPHILLKHNASHRIKTIY
jgi:hypothetical protein